MASRARLQEAGEVSLNDAIPIAEISTGSGVSGPSVRILGRTYPVVLPQIRDPRIHLSFITISLFVIGIGFLGFAVSVAQILSAVVVCVAIEVVVTARRSGILIWPASALQTASSTALILRVEGTRNGDLWTFRGWYVFAAVAAFGVLTKHALRIDGRHLFNPSNIALVLAFLLLGESRIEPLDLWWGPVGIPLLLAYAVIAAGGVAIAGRLHLIAMGVAFWLALAFGLGVLASAGHAISARWSLTPLEGAHFWWIVMSSPEVLVFLFFMLTDPRTVPAGRTARIVFGLLVAGLASLLIAPWTTEYSTKVALLASLAIVCAARPLLERRLPAPGSRLDDPMLFARRLLAGPSPAPTIGGVVVRLGIGVVAAALFGLGVVGAGLGARPAGESSIPTLADRVPPVDPSSLPVVAIDRHIAKFSSELATPAGAQDLAATLAWNLAVEHEALRSREPELLSAVDHGYRLDQMERTIDESARGGVVTASLYRFDALRLLVVFPGGAQAGANAGFVATGEAIDVTYGPAGAELSRASRPFGTTFAMRQTTSGAWQITDTLAVPKQ